jgi:cyanate permease
MGVEWLFAAISATMLLLAFALTTISDQPRSAPGGEQPRAVANTAPLNRWSVIRNPTFWMLSLSVGIVSGLGMMYSTHVVAMATDGGVDAVSAAFLLSIFAVSGLAGTLLLGWSMDVVGLRPPMIAIGALPLAAWLALGLDRSYTTYVVTAIALGACVSSVYMVTSEIATRIYGKRDLSTVLGMTYVLKLPFIFVPIPLAGYLFDVTGAYDATVLLSAGASLIVLMCYSAIKINRADRSEDVAL